MSVHIWSGANIFRILFGLACLCLTFSSVNAQFIWPWAQSVPSTGANAFQHIVTAPATGSTYAVGNYQGDISTTFPPGVNATPNLSTTLGPQDGLVAKFDGSGNPIWAFRIGGAGCTATIREATLGPAGFLYVIGNFSGTCQFQGVTTSPTQSFTAIASDVFVAKYDSDGNLVWARQLSNNDDADGYGITTDANAVYITGRFRNNNGTLDGGGNPNQVLVNIAGWDIFMAAYNLAGDILWSRVCGGINGERGISVTSDGTNVFFVGRFASPTCNFFPGMLPLNNADGTGTHDGWVASYTTSGGLNWVQRFGSDDQDQANDIVHDATGLYLTGGINDNGSSVSFPGGATVMTGNSRREIFTCRLFKATGLTDWVYAEITPDNSPARGQDLIRDGVNLYVVGSMSGNTQFNGGANPLTSAGAQDVFLLHRLTNGTFVDVAIGGGTGADHARGVGYDNSGNIYIGGEFSSSANFGGNMVSTLGTVAGFVATLRPPCDASFSYGQATYCASAGNPSAVITGDPGGVFSSPSPNVVFANTATGEINLGGSTAGGPYKIYYDSPNICRDSFNISIDAAPTPALAGPDQTLCGTSIGLLAGFLPSVGSGLWSTVTGPGVATFPNASGSPVTGLGNGINEFQWATMNGVCPVSRDTVRITVDQAPSNAFAGPDQTICTTNTTLAGNMPLTGMGNWGIISGSATFANAAQFNTGVTGLALGVNELEWVISNGGCPPSRDTVIITVNAGVSTSMAGPDQSLCNVTTATLAGNAPTLGMGSWNALTPGPVVTSPTLPGSGVTGLVIGSNEFEWVISNGGCTPSRDTVVITVDAPPSTALAGPDQTVCGTATTLAGNAPATGTGAWTVTMGTGTFANAALPNTGVTGLSVGVNEFTWTISNGGCPPSVDVVRITVSPPPSVAMAGPDQALCNTTSATLAGNVPGTGNGNWTAITVGPVVTSPGLAGSGVTGLLIGANEFEWVISSGSCPPTRDTVVITVDAPPTTAMAGPDQTVCATSATLAGNTPVAGTGVWTVTMGTGTFANVALPNTGVTGLSAGVNEFTWTISNGGCPPSVDVVRITVSPPPSMAMAGPNQALCNTTSATLAGNVPGTGNGNWTAITVGPVVTSPGLAGSGVTGLLIGANEFEWVISSGSCPATRDTVVITVDAPPTTAMAGPDQTVCATSATLAGNAPVTGTGAWTVTMGTGTLANAALSNTGVTGLSVGINEFTWTISNGVCPPSSDVVRITVNTPPSAAMAGPDQALCNTTSATLAGNVPGTGNGNWTAITVGPVVTSPGLAGSGVTGLLIGANEFEWVISSGSCPPTRDTVVITVDAPPTTAMAGPDQTVCATSATLAGNAPVTGTGAWTVTMGTGTFANAALPNTTVTGLSPGINEFTWTISNGVCPSSSDVVRITVNTPPSTALAGPDQTLCNTTTATLAGNLPATGTGTWAAITAGPIVTSPGLPGSGVTGLLIGANEFEWVISNGPCPPSRDTVVITVDAPPTSASAGPDQILCDPVATLAGNAPTIGTGTWTITAGTGTFSNANAPNSTVSGLSIGVNEFTWTIANGTCPGSSDTVRIQVDAPPTTATAGPDQDLCGQSTAILVANAPLTGTGSWSVATGTATVTAPGMPNSGVTGLSTGTNTFIWTISNGTCPSSQDTLVIEVGSLPTAALAGSDQEICTDTSNLMGNAPVIGTGVWRLVSGAGTIVSPNNPATALTSLGPGVNEFAWQISSGSCPPSADTLQITRRIAPTVFAGADAEICGDTFALQGMGGQGLASWQGGPGISFDDPGDPLATATVSAGGVYPLTWTYDDGVCRVVDTVAVTFHELPGPADAGADQDIGSASSVVLQAAGGYVGTGRWTSRSGSVDFSDPTDPQATASNLQAGDNFLVWTISNGTCLPVSDEVVIRSGEISIPTGFSPNEDLVNDTFVIRGAKQGEIVRIQIFNRWGNKVFQDDNYQNDWRGTNFNGDMLPDDTYYHITEIGQKRFAASVVIKR